MNINTAVQVLLDQVMAHSDAGHTGGDVSGAAQRSGKRRHVGFVYDMESVLYGLRALPVTNENNNNNHNAKNDIENKN